jgi:hypothetical protein
VQAFDLSDRSDTKKGPIPEKFPVKFPGVDPKSETLKIRYSSLGGEQMSKSKSSPRVFSREFKLGVVRRMLAGENVSALGRELKLMRKDLYVWRDRFLAGGRAAAVKSVARSQ